MTVRVPRGVASFVGAPRGIRRLFAHGIATARGRLIAALVGDAVAQAYHRWYYESGVHFRISWEGVPTLKSVQDLWIYQELIWELQPSVVLEFGSYRGGSALWFARVLDAIGSGRVICVETDVDRVDDRARFHPRVNLWSGRSTDPDIVDELARLRSSDAAPWFVILDSDHSFSNVLAELEAITPFLRSGDRVVVEDGNINGHPVRPGWGPGPFEAVEEFHRRHPDAYLVDRQSEEKFGWTFAPSGFLLRQ